MTSNWMQNFTEIWTFCLNFQNIQEKIEKTIINIQPKFEIFKKYIENSYFVKEYINFAPISDLCHI